MANRRNLYSPMRVGVERDLREQFLSLYKQL
jgi:hypothetical protein